MAFERAGTRTTVSTVRFYHPFKLGRDPRELPPGVYLTHLHEEMYQGANAPMYLSVSVDFVVEVEGRTTTRIVSPDDLRSALVRDEASQCGTDDAS